MKVLVAEDSETSLVLITLVLKEQGHEVISVLNTQDAIETYQRIKPDLIMLNIVMEGMDGFECARTMRSMAQEDEWVPIIFLCNTVDDSSLAKGIDAGADDYLIKPFSKITLIAKIKAMQRICNMRKKLYATSKKLEVITATDTLTGIFNRSHFDYVINKKLDSSKVNLQFALLILDLDNFKVVNDSYGHQIGDLLLKQIASRLREILKPHDFLARIGGDEFAIILSDIENSGVAGHVAQKILDILMPDYHLLDKKIRISASIGIALYPYKSMTQINIVQNAGLAMHHAKELGRNSYHYYTLELKEKYKQHVHLEQALLFALEKNEFYLKYQPVLDLNTNEVVGFESLICWDNLKFGTIFPSIFIPIAEEIGLIAPIGNWVIKQACEHAKQTGLDKIKNFKLGINVSSYQLLQEDFYQNIVDILKETQIPARLLEFEITETTPMDYASTISRQTLKKVRELGITIAIDDFGTGYSSLTRLKDLTFDTLKIDQIFVQEAVNDYNTNVILKTLINMGKELKLNIIAEGIETTTQLKFLTDLGCKKGQGYLLGKAMYAEHIKYFISQHVKTK